MRRKAIKNIKKRIYLMYGLSIMLLVSLIVFGTIMLSQILSLKACIRDAINNIENLEDNTVVYETNLNTAYISKSVCEQLVQNSLKLSIKMPGAVLDIADGYIGFVQAPTVTGEEIQIAGISVKSVKVSNVGLNGLQSIKVNAEDIKQKLEFIDVLDIYEEQGEDFVLSKTIEVKEYIEVESKTQYLVYIAPQDIVIEDNITLYNNISQKLEVSVLPLYATYMEPRYTNYDESIIQITKSGEILPKGAGKTTLTCVVGNIEKEVTLQILPTVEKITVNKPITTIKLGNWSYIIPSIYPKDASNSKLVWMSSDEKIATVEDGMIKSKGIGSCVVTVTTQSKPKVQCEIKVTVTVTNKSSGYYTQGTGGYPETIIEGPYYVDGMLIVNKKYSIPEDFATGLDKEAYAALKNLQNAASKAGYSLPMVSGFRTYSFQKRLYENYIKRSGQGAADTYSARPGHSEHSTGLSFDVGSVTNSYGTTPAGKWLAKNCYKYGFIIRYPQGKSNITGYIYEPWHIRYLGVENATKVYNSGLTLEEYLGLN